LVGTNISLTKLTEINLILIFKINLNYLSFIILGLNML